MDSEAYETFWYWVNERQRIYLNKKAGETKPWSEDPIFQHWKFCNVFRTQDTQTSWLIRKILDPNHDGNPADILFNIYAFRAFNWADTYEWISAGQWFSDSHPFYEIKVKQLLLQKIMAHKQLTSGAYMIRGRFGQSKSVSIPETLQHIWNMRAYLLDRIQDEPITTMEDMQDLLLAQKFWGWGPFTTYQVVLDLTYTRFLQGASDINSWCEFGPGAKRGIRCIWPEARNGQMLDYARQLYFSQDGHLEDHVPSMTLQDIEFSLCELSKYLRIKRGGRSKATYAGI